MHLFMILRANSTFTITVAKILGFLTHLPQNRLFLIACYMKTDYL